VDLFISKICRTSYGYLISMVVFLFSRYADTFLAFLQTIPQASGGQFNQEVRVRANARARSRGSSYESTRACHATTKSCRDTRELIARSHARTHARTIGAEGGSTFGTHLARETHPRPFNCRPRRAASGRSNIARIDLVARAAALFSINKRADRVGIREQREGASEEGRE